MWSLPKAACEQRGRPTTIICYKMHNSLSPNLVSCNYPKTYNNKHLLCAEICSLGTTLFCPQPISWRDLTKAGRFVFRMVTTWLVSWWWLLVPSHMGLCMDSSGLLPARWLVSSYDHEDKVVVGGKWQTVSLSVEGGGWFTKEGVANEYCRKVKQELRNSPWIGRPDSWGSPWWEFLY